jgi:hypothetical protein
MTFSKNNFCKFPEKKQKKYSLEKVRLKKHSKQWRQLLAVDILGPGNVKCLTSGYILKMLQPNTAVPVQITPYMQYITNRHRLTQQTTDQVNMLLIQKNWKKLPYQLPLHMGPKHFSTSPGAQLSYLKKRHP